MVKLAQITNLVIWSLFFILLVILVNLLCNYVSVELYACIRVGKSRSVFVLADDLMRGHDVVVGIVDFKPDLWRFRIARKVYRDLIQQVFDLLFQVRLNLTIIHESFTCFVQFNLFVN